VSRCASTRKEGAVMASRKKKKKSKPDDIRTLIGTDDDGTIQITLVNLNGRPSSIYRYSTKTGKLEKNGRYPVEWIGQIAISPNLRHRAWVPIANIFQGWGIPTELKQLEQFIKTRGKDRLWYTIQLHVKNGDKKRGSIFLPNLLHLAKATFSTVSKGTAIISNVMVAPHRQGQGFGTMLHLLAASHLKSLGYTKMLSDIVGMNTDAEIAIWKSLQKQLRVTPFKESYSTTRLLRDSKVIDNRMFRIMQKHTGGYFSGVMMAQEQISRKKFQQFELDLTDERIPLFMMEQPQKKKAA
jgi:hypothetical protein